MWRWNMHGKWVQVSGFYAVFFGALGLLMDGVLWSNVPGKAVGVEISLLELGRGNFFLGGEGMQEKGLGLHSGTKKIPG